MAILAAPTGNEVNLLEVMLHAGPVAKVVMVILITFSLLSWVAVSYTHLTLPTKRIV